MTTMDYAVATGIPQKLLDMPISLTTGEHISLSDFKGEKPVYLKFWATWCQPCRKEMPHFEHVQQAYGETIKVIGINLGVNDTLKDVAETQEEFGLSMSMAIDSSGDLAQHFRLLGTPYHLLFDKNMNLVHVGNAASEQLDNKLALVSKEQTVDLLNVDTIIETAKDLSLPLGDGEVHALFFTSTWCDWYLKDSRPQVSQGCIVAQKNMNTFTNDFPNISWHGIASRLWTGEKDLLEYKKKFSPAQTFAIDQSNQLFHQYQVKDLPTLVVVKNGEVLLKTSDLSKREKTRNLLMQFF